MKLLDIILTANRNLLRSKVRTVFTILAIFVGGFTLTLTTALNTGANQYLQRQVGNVSVPGVFQVVTKTDVNPLQSDGVKEYDPNKRQGSVADLLNSTFMQSDIDVLSKVEGVEIAHPLYNNSALYIARGDSTGKKYQVAQVVQNIWLNLDLAEGRLLTDADTNSIVISEDYATSLGLTGSEAIGATLKLGFYGTGQNVLEKELAIVGVMKKSFLTSGQLYVSYDVARHMAEDQGKAEPFFGGIVRFKDATDATDETVLKKRLQEAGNYTAMSVKERIGTITTIIGAVTMGLNLVGIVALLAASFGIINTLLMSVYERTQEVGLMKALGMRRARVFSLFA
ncbi:MAG TPA: ABC transporter permease, partial [Magnetospirillaceae bacterium]|nr:ABC transporter permease [Magnetospirillaceae bacterium]